MAVPDCKSILDTYQVSVDELAQLRADIEAMESGFIKSQLRSEFKTKWKGVIDNVGPDCEGELKYRFNLKFVNIKKKIKDVSCNHRGNIMVEKQEQFLLSCPLAVISQQPVGHGGFHVGALGTTKPSIRWVYDCGA